MPHRPRPALAPDATLAVSVKFDSVVLVYGDCEKRSNGPTGLTAKQVRKDLKHQLTAAPRKFRVVQTRCISMCPKKSLVVVTVPAGRPLLAVELKSESDVAHLAALMLNQR